jgi:hypothetical protein
VTPPGRRPRQPHQPGGLRGDAVDSHELLLLAHRAEKAERVRAEADQPDGRQRRQAESDRHRHSDAFAYALRSQHEERQHQTGAHLDPHAHHQGHGCRAQARAARNERARRACGRGAVPRVEPILAAGAGRRDRKGAGKQQQDQRVVVRSAEGQLEQHRVQSHEGHSPSRRATRGTRGAPGQRDCSKACQDGDRL